MPWYRARRLQVFLIVFFLVLIPGLAWDFLRPPQYRATASLLTVVEHPGAAPGVLAQADVQHVSIQRQVLLGRELLEEAFWLARDQGLTGVASPDALLPILDVAPLPDTNLVGLSATGAEPENLAILVNAWIQGYLSLRQRELEREVGDRQRALEEEHAALEGAIEERRLALEDFRAEHDIVTLERDGNEALARLKALTDDLNRARDEALEAEARLASVREAVERGEPVVPAADEADLSDLEAQAMALRNRLVELEKRFTPLYLQNEPDLQVIPAQLAALEARIAGKIALGRERVLALLQQEVVQARRRVQAMEAEMESQKGLAKSFTADFARYQTLEAELQRLEETSREVQAKVLELAAKELEKYPPVEVIEPAHPPATPFAPAYWRDAAWVLLAAGIAALSAVLLLEFLTRRPREDRRPVPVTGVRVFSGGPAPAPELAGAPPRPPGLGHGAPPALEQAPRPALEAARSRELIPAEVDALWELADPMSRELMALLLSGLTLDECADVQPGHFELEAGTLMSPGEPGRRISLPARARDLFLSCRPLPLWAAGGTRLTPEELSTRIGLLAHDVGLSQPGEVTADALRHTYLAFLVRQGARLTELESLVGPMAPSRLAAYASLAPGGPARSLSDVDLVYPTLKSRASGDDALNPG